MINLKEHVNGLFLMALEGEKSVSCLEEDGNCFAYYDEDNDYERHYYYNDTPESIAGRILTDPEIDAFLPKDGLAGFIIENAGHDTLMTMEKLVIIKDDEEGRSPSRDKLEEEYHDEYAQFIADGFLGQTWTDRQISVVNVSAILESCHEIHEPSMDPPFDMFFLEAVLQTVFHELRHLFYECNEIVAIGEGTPYPQDGGLEDNVEEYGDKMASVLLDKFIEIVDGKALSSFLKKEGRNRTAC